jgi:hypothetical protein
MRIWGHPVAVSESSVPALCTLLQTGRVTRRGRPTRATRSHSQHTAATLHLATARSPIRRDYGSSSLAMCAGSIENVLSSTLDETYVNIVARASVGVCGARANCVNIRYLLVFAFDFWPGPGPARAPARHSIFRSMCRRGLATARARGPGVRLLDQVYDPSASFTELIRGSRYSFTTEQRAIRSGDGESAITVLATAALDGCRSGTDRHVQR